MMSAIHQQVTGFTTAMFPVPTSTSNQVEIYSVELKQDEDERFVATVPKLPGVVTDGATEDESLDNVNDAIQAMLEAKGLEKQFILINFS